MLTPKELQALKKEIAAFDLEATKALIEREAVSITPEEEAAEEADEEIDADSDTMTP